MLSLDQITEKVLRYRENNRDKNFHFHNTYYMYTEDRDGNITGEAYGTNLMTDYGFNRICTLGTSNQNDIIQQFYIGTGTTPPTLQDTAMEKYVATSTYTRTYNPVETSYDKTKKILYETVTAGNGWFDYNIAGYGDINISEIGCGPAYNQLYFRFLVRDETGKVAPIVKHANEKLYLYVYHTFCLHRDFMWEPLKRGEYVLAEPYVAQNFAYNYRNYIYAYANNRGYCWHYKTWSMNYRNGYTAIINYGTNYYPDHYFNQDVTHNTIEADHKCEYTINSTSCLVEDPTVYIGQTISTFTNTISSATSGLSFYPNGASAGFVLTIDKQPSDETMVSFDVYTNTVLTNRINHQYGYSRNTSTKIGSLPCVDYKVQTCHMFNVKDNDWTIAESVHQDANYQSFDSFGIRCVWDRFKCPDGILRDVWVYVNPFTSMKIVKFTNTAITLFAASEAWDTSTWTQIQNLANVPDALSNARYYICYSDVKLDYEYKDENYPYIETTTQPVELTADYHHDNVPIVGYDDNNWFATGRDVFIMNDDRTIKAQYPVFENWGFLSYYRRYAYKNKLLVFNTTDDQTTLGGFAIINANGEPTQYQLPMLFGKLTTLYTNDNGNHDGRYVVGSLPYGDEANRTVIIDMEKLNITDETRTVTVNEYDGGWQYGYVNSSGGRAGDSYWQYTIGGITIPYNGNNNERVSFITVTAKGTSTVKYPELWGWISYYDANNNFLGNSEYQKLYPFTSTGGINDIPAYTAYIKLSLHQGIDRSEYSDGYFNNGSYIESIKVDFTFTKFDGISYIDDCVRAYCIKNTNYITYQRKEDGIRKHYIQDISDLSKEPTSFEIEEGQASSWLGTMGFNEYIYLYMSDSNGINSTWLYDMSTDKLTHLTDMNIDIANDTLDTCGRVCANDRILIFGKTIAYAITRDDPTHYRTFSTYVGGSPRLKYLNGGKQLVWSVGDYNNFNQSRANLNVLCRTYDVGVWLQNKSWPVGEPVERFTLTDRYQSSSYTYYQTYQYPYKSGIITLLPYRHTLSGWTLYYYPIEHYVPHKTVGTTRTITAYNNPIEISGKSYQLIKTNDMSLLGLNNN